MRQVYCCKPPYFMVGSDLSGIEARMLGHFTTPFDGGAMATQLLQGDIHTETANKMGIDRNKAKTIRYALMYGAGVGKVMSILSCSKSDAEKAIALFYEASPALKMLNDRLKEFYKKHKYIKAINGSHLMIRSDHVLLNSLIQASSAIIFKRWSCIVWSEIERLSLDAKIIIMMHDELQLRVHERDLEKIKEVLQRTLKETQEFYKISVELKTDTRIGSNWRDCH